MVTAIEGATVNTLKSTNPSYQLLVGWKVVISFVDYAVAVDATIK